MTKNNLKRICLDLEMKYPVTQISRDLGYSKGTISEYVNDKREMSQSFIEQFENFYNIKFSDYNQPDPESEEEQTEDIVSLLRELLREREKRMEEKDEFIEYLKRENTELRARLSDAGSGEAV